MVGGEVAGSKCEGLRTRPTMRPKVTRVGDDADLRVDHLCDDLLFGGNFADQPGIWPDNGRAAGAWTSTNSGVDRHSQQADDPASWSVQSSIIHQSQFLYMPELDGLPLDQRGVLSNAYAETQTQRVIREAAQHERAGIEEMFPDTLSTGTGEKLPTEKLPNGWEERRAPDGRRYFVDHCAQKTQWEDPRKTRKQIPPPPSGPPLQPDEQQPNDPNGLDMFGTNWTVQQSEVAWEQPTVPTGASLAPAGGTIEQVRSRIPVTSCEGRPVTKPPKRRKSKRKKQKVRWEWPAADDPAREHKSAIRFAALHRFRQKKIERANRPKNVRYKSRKKIADDRPRISGRFVKTASVMRAGEDAS